MCSLFLNVSLTNRPFARTALPLLMCLLLKIFTFVNLQGNDHFKAARYEKSIECYTKGMQYDANNAVLPANRAMAYLKLKR